MSLARFYFLGCSALLVASLAFTFAEWRTTGLIVFIIAAILAVLPLVVLAVMLALWELTKLIKKIRG
jgi:hypothetical protein